MYFILICLCLASLLAAVKTVFFSFDIDEGYAIAQGYRMAMGDRLLQTMWEPHQLSAYPVALFSALFTAITGSTTGIVIGLRIFGTVIHLLIGLLFAGCTKRLLNGREQVILFLIHFNFLAKWIQMPEFEIMHYWLLLAGFCLTWKYYTGKRRAIWLVLLGVVMLLQVCNYPTMLFLYPFYIWGLVKSGVRPWKESVLATLGAVVPGLAFVGYLVGSMGVQKLITNIAYVVEDPSHNDKTFAVKLLVYGKEFLQAILLVGAIWGGTFLLTLLIRGCKKRFELSFLLSITGMSIAQLVGCLLFDQNQFFLQERYFLAAVFATAYYFVGNKKTNSNARFCMLFLIVPAWVSFLAALFISNMNVVVAFSKLFVCVPAAFFLLFMECKEEKRLLGIDFSAIVVIGSLLFCKLILIRVTGCLPVTMNAHFARVTDGPAKGIYVQEQYAYPMNANCDLLKQYLTKEDKLLYYGCENITYLDTGAQISAASTLSTAVFNEMFLEYFEQNPEKYPTAIAVDKLYETNPFYQYNEKSIVLKEWIETLAYEEKIETDTCVLYLGVK